MKDPLLWLKIMLRSLLGFGIWLMQVYASVQGLDDKKC